MIQSSKPGKITDNFYCLGPREVPSFLLDGDHPIVFEAGIYIFAQSYLREIQKIMGDRNPEYLFLTHMHFDHCGAAGYLKRNIPELKIGASSEGSNIIRKPSAVDLITRLNNLGGMEISFEPFTVDRILTDGDRIDVSSKYSVEVIKTPGHTRDMLTFYIPELKIMIPSESVGVPTYDGYIFSEFLIDYDIYLESLKKLEGYDVEFLLLAHGAYFTGKDAREHIPRAIEFTGRFRERIEYLLNKHGEDIDTISMIIKKEEYDTVKGEKQIEQAYMLNLHAKIRAIARRMREK